MKQQPVNSCFLQLVTNQDLQVLTLIKPAVFFSTLAVNAKFYSDKELDVLSSAAIGLGKILRCEKALDFTSRGLQVYEGMDEMKIQLIDAIKVKHGSPNELVSFILTETAPVFTYSNATSQNLSSGLDATRYLDYINSIICHM